jgi:DNA-binding NarL/FixJ family response regulator
MAQLQVAVLDQQRTFADALGARLRQEHDLTVTEAVLTARPDLGFIMARPADVILLDADLPGDVSVWLCTRLSGQDDPPRVIMLSDTSEPPRIVRALRAGAAAWVRKDDTIERLLAVVRGVPRGDMDLPAAELGSVLRMLLRGEGEQEGEDRLLAELTPREREVLLHLARGSRRQDVARELHLSGHTVRTHMQNLMAKLGVHSTLEAVAVARSRLDLQSLEGPAGRRLP